MTGDELGVGRALAALAGERPDVADILAHLVADCAASSGASAVGVLARVETDGGLDLLAATSHRSAEIDLWQAQETVGPCVEAIEGSRVVTMSSRGAGRPDSVLGTLMSTAGFAEVMAFPVTWRGTTLAGLNLCWPRSEESPAAADLPLRAEAGQVYADLIALAIAQPALVDARAVRGQLSRSLADRSLVEQAKGVLAYVERLDMGQAYERLLAITASSPLTLSEVAAEVVRHRGAPTLA